jgi:hypothetical protein
MKLLAIFSLNVTSQKPLGIWWLPNSASLAIIQYLTLVIQKAGLEFWLVQGLLLIKKSKIGYSGSPFGGWCEQKEIEGFLKLRGFLPMP